MCIRARINELHVNPHFVSGSLDSTFYNVRNTELLRDCLQIFGLALVLCRRGARDNLQICNAGKFGQDFILNAFSKVSVGFIVA
jgi:hypothetical protein